MAEWLRKTYRVDIKTDEKIKELVKIYKLRTENDLIKAVIDDIYDLKRSKALIPFEEYEKTDIELKKALLEIGRLNGILEEREKKKSFWAKFFGKWNMKKRHVMRYKINIKKTEESYAVWAPSLPGCWSQGKTEKEVIENIKDAIKFYLETVKETNLSLINYSGETYHWRQMDASLTLLDVSRFIDKNNLMVDW